MSAAWAEGEQSLIPEEPEGEPLTPDESAEANELIEQLLEQGFTYDRVGRVNGLAAHAQGGDDGTGDGDPDQAGDGDDTGDGDTEAPDGGDREGDTAPGDGTGTGDGGEGERPGDQPHVGDQHGAGDTPQRAVAPELLGVGLSDTEARGLLAFRQKLLDHPELAGQVNDLILGARNGTKPPPEEKPLPDFIDPDDPTAVGIWRQVEEMQRSYEEDRQQQAAAVERDQKDRAARDIAAGVERFKAAHPDLTDDEIQLIRAYTSANVNVPGVMTNFPDDPAEGIARALEIGSMTDPAVRDKVLGSADAGRHQRDAKDRTRKRTLGALSGSQGSGSRRAPAPKKPSNWNEAAAMMAAEIEKL